jgi:aryl-alcohol dehydrogenase-like predicted oxidoreductase
MDYIKLGRTGLEVSRICLGCMSYGSPASQTQPWALPESESRPFIKQAIELGINFFDTANVYSGGASEEVLGRALKEHANRDEVVIATKLWGRMRSGPNGAGLSRKEVFTELDASLRRLGTDYVDLYQIHRWDYTTPIEETLDALDDVVRSGKVRYLGASSMYAWQLAQALGVATARHLTRFVSMQNYLNLLYREEEREMLPLCKAEGIAIIPWSPLARGRLARPWGSVTNRSEKDVFGVRLYAGTAEADRKVVERVGEVAAARGVPRAQVALAWVLRKPEVAAPVIGATRPEHLKDAVAALAVKLTDEEVNSLEEPYIPHAVVGFS